MARARPRTAASRTTPAPKARGGAAPKKAAKKTSKEKAPKKTEPKVAPKKTPTKKPLVQGSVGKRAEATPAPPKPRRAPGRRRPARPEEGERAPTRRRGPKDAPGSRTPAEPEPSPEAPGKKRGPARKAPGKKRGPERKAPGKEVPVRAPGRKKTSVKARSRGASPR